MALSFGISFYQKLFYDMLMKFVKRDLILLAGSFLIVLGLTPFMAPVYAVIISIGIFFGIKTFTYNRQKFLEKNIGEGFCAQCGEQIINKKCPNCDKSEES
jgi:hypothetical protein